MRGLKGKTAIVTGGAQGIGKAIVERLVEEDTAVLIADIADDYSRTMVEELRVRGASVQSVHSDVTDENAVKAMVDRCVREFGEIDYLVNCAAVFIMRGIDATVEEWRRIMDANIMGQALCVKHALPHFSTSRPGAIVNIASISGHIAQPEYLTYNVTKAAVANMTRCMALDLADWGIRVNAVNPGTVWNANNERFHREQLGMDRAQADAHLDIGGRHLLKRTADPSEIASAVAFLLSDEASFITGENLMVDGGYTAV